jgi:hypothetical protein
MATIVFDPSKSSFTGTSATNDTLEFNTSNADLGSITLSSIEILEANTTFATTFTLDQADLAKNGTISGTAKEDTILAHGAKLDLTSTTLSSIEILGAGTSKATTFVVDHGALTTLNEIDGSAGVDTLQVNASDIDLRGITLDSIEILKTGATVATDFFLDVTSGISSIVGTAKGGDTLHVQSTSFDLSQTTLSGIKTLQAGSTSSTTFTVDQADLAKGGSIIGSTSAADTIISTGTSLDLSSTSLSGIEILKAGSSNATTFTIGDPAATGLGSIVGSATSLGKDTLVVKATGIDLHSTTLTSIEILKAGLATASTFTLDDGQLAGANKGSIVSIVGGSGKDTLQVVGSAFDLSSVSLSSIEVLQGDATQSTTFTLNQADLAKNGSILGGSGGADTISAVGTFFDLTSTTLSSIEVLKISGGSSNGNIVQISQAQFASLDVQGTKAGRDALFVTSTNIDLTSRTMSSVEVIAAGLGKATTFTVDKTDLASGKGDIDLILGSGKDTLIVKGTDFNLAGVSVRGIEFLKADTANGTSATTFTLSQGDRLAGSTIIGSTNAGDTVEIATFSGLDLSSTKLSGIEDLKLDLGARVGLSLAQFNALGQDHVVGKAGAGNGIFFADANVDLTKTTLSGIDEIAGLYTKTAVKFTVDLADLATGGTVQGQSAIDTLTVVGTAFDLSHTHVLGIEKLVASTPTGTDGTVFTVDQADLAGNGSIIGTKNVDTLIAAGSSLDLSSTTLTSIEILKAGSTSATTFIVDKGDLAAGGSVIGTGKDDTLQLRGSLLDLTSTTLTSIEILKTTDKIAGTFIVDKLDLAAGGSVIGNTGTVDTLIIKDTAFDLSSTTLTNIDVLKAGVAAATTFTIDPADLTAGGSIIGSSGIDTLAIAGTGTQSVDLSSTTLTSIEVLKSLAAGGTHFALNQADLVSGGSVIGSAGTGDQLQFVNSPIIDLTSTTLTNVELVFSFSTDTTVFKVDQADLSAKYSGGADSTTLMIHGTSLDLTSTTLTFFSKLTTDSAKGTVFTVDQADLDALHGEKTVAGGAGVDSLIIHGTGMDLTGTNFASIEKLGTDSTQATTFIVNAEDLTALGKAGVITGSAALGDTLLVHNDGMNLTNITLNGIETLKLDSAGTTFTLDQSDIASLGTTGAIIGDNSTLSVHGSMLDLSSTSLTSVVVLTTDSAKAATFIVDQDDLAGGGSIIGSKAIGDTLVSDGSSLDLTSTTLTGIETLKVGSFGVTHTTLDQADINTLTSLVGGTGNDILTATNLSGDTIDLTHLKFTGIENIDTATKDGHVSLTLGAGQAGATLTLNDNAAIDTIHFAADYKVTAVTTDAAILSHTLTVSNFEDGAGGDVLDLGNLLHGTPGSVTSVDVSAAADLKSALNLAAAGNGGTNSAIVTFEFGNDTYVLVDNSASKTLGVGDSVIKLIGHHDLTAADFSLV